MTPLVSICVITYNQEKTISQTLDSILNQKIEFPIEIIIGEDCSVDNTRNICLAYQEKYPDIIKLILHEENQGLLKNYKSVLVECIGKYIAQCAGDDYWHNPNKLKLQVDFLETNPDYGLVHSNVVRFNEKKQRYKKIKKSNIPQGFVYNNLLVNGNFISALTVLFRRELLIHVEFDEYIRHNFLMEDYPLWLTFSQHTKFYYFNYYLATYRIGTNTLSRPTDYVKSCEFVDNVFFMAKYFYQKKSDRVLLNDIRQKYFFNRLMIAIKFNKKDDIKFYLNQVATKNVKQKLIKCILTLFMWCNIYSLYKCLTKG